MHCTADFYMCHYARFSQIGSQMSSVKDVYIYSEGKTLIVSFRYDVTVIEDINTKALKIISFSYDVSIMIIYVSKAHNRNL